MICASQKGHAEIALLWIPQPSIEINSTKTTKQTKSQRDIENRIRKITAFEYQHIYIIINLYDFSKRSYLSYWIISWTDIKFIIMKMPLIDSFFDIGKRFDFFGLGIFVHEIKYNSGRQIAIKSPNLKQQNTKFDLKINQWTKMINKNN